MIYQIKNVTKLKFMIDLNFMNDHSALAKVKGLLKYIVQDEHTSG